MIVCVQGLWHLGTVTAACLASLGHSVTGLDSDVDTIANLNDGVLPVAEPGLDQLIHTGMEAGRLGFTANPEAGLARAEILWITYDTPVSAEDEADVEFVFRQIDRSLDDLPRGAMVVVSSQLPAGSMRRLEDLAASRCPDKAVRFAYSPENLRLGDAIDAFLKPERIVVGVRSSADREDLQRLFGTITDRIIWMSIESAEMTKHAINAFLATSVTFANEIAAICESVGADAKEVEQGLKTERRIGPRAYLAPGAAFAGGTLARDVAFLNVASRAAGLASPLLASISTSNEEHKRWSQRLLAGLLSAGAPVAVLGLAYKPGTDTLRRSASVELCDWLILHGASVRVHDPAVRDLPPAWNGKVARASSALDAMAGARAVVVATEWPEYRNISGEDIATMAPATHVLDPGRFLAHLSGTPGLTYVAVGTPRRGLA